MTNNGKTSSGGTESGMVRSVTAVRTLLLTDFVDSTRLLESLGDQKGAQLFARNDQIARALLSDHGGTEIDKTDGFLFLFQRPIDATRFALAYHQALKELSSTYGVSLSARAAIHVGEVVERRNAQEDIERGAKPVEVEGLAKPLVARLMGLGMGGQTLMTKFAFDIAKRAVVGDEGFPKDARWMSHGWFNVKGIDDPIMVCEVGVPGTAPLCPPPDSEKAWKAKDEPTGWGPRHWMFSVGVVGILLSFAILWQGQSELMVTQDETMPVVAEESALVDRSEEQVEAEVEPPSLVELEIDSQPTGALIRYGNSDLGFAPVLLKLPAEVGSVPVQAVLPRHEDTTSICEVGEAEVAAGKATCLVDLPLQAPRPMVRKSRPPAPSTAPSEATEATKSETTATRKPNIQLIE